jgi:hypothetical protein
MATGKPNGGSRLIGGYHLQIGNSEHPVWQGFLHHRYPRYRFTIRVSGPWKLTGDKHGLESLIPAS